MSKPLPLVFFLVAVLVAAAGCGGGGIAPIVSYQSAYPTLGELEQMIQNSVEPDADGDFIPDNIEQGVLGTDPKDRDTDRDGLPDNYEIFGEGIFDPDAYIPDMDRDDIIAPLDKDDDGDFINDGLSIDTDGDYVANYLEYYGYTYDWLTGRFVSCEDIDCSGLPIYKSDPLQRSTDQDVYPDGMEASQAGMDVSVGYPGNHPLVPAYPELVVELVGYSVTLDADIEVGKGESISEEQTWSREASGSHTFTSEANFEGGVDVGGTDIFKLSGKAGGGISWANETGFSVSEGGSIVHQREWSETRSSNPTSAAHIKLLLKVHNTGTTSVSNIVPTLTLRIAGLNVTTFEPGNPQINLLTAGAIYPAEEGVYWVVDSTNLGAPLTLTLTELKALETGAPVGISMTQVKGDVLRLNEDGSWESAGECAEFVARCDSACANLLLDMGDGNSLHRMVYCGDGPSGPAVTLEEALRWTANGTMSQGHYEVTFMNDEGVLQTQSLDDWSFAFDRETLEHNGFDPDDLGGSLPPNFELGKMVLLPDSVVIGKAPGFEQPDKPDIHFASIDTERRSATVCATDYRGVEKVEVVAMVDPGDGSGPTTDRWLMEERTAGSNLYVYLFEDEEWEIIDGILERTRHPVAGASDRLSAEAMAIGGALRDEAFGEAPPPPEPVAPIITHVSLDVSSHELYARVRPDPAYPSHWQEQYPVLWAEAFHPAFDGGHVKLTRVDNWYEDPYGMRCDLPVNFAASNVKIVAFVAPGVYAERVVEAGEIAHAFAQGQRVTRSEFRWSWPSSSNIFNLYDFYNGTVLDLEKTNGDVAYWDQVAPGTPWKFDTNSPSFYFPYHYYCETWVQWDNRAGQQDWIFGFGREAAKITNVSFDNVTYDVAKANIQSDPVYEGPVVKDEVWVCRTWDHEGSDHKYRLAKLKVLKKHAWQATVLFVPINQRFCDTTFKFVVFPAPQAVITDSDNLNFTIKVGDSVELEGDSSVHAQSYLWELYTWPAGSTQPQVDGVTQTKGTTSFQPDKTGEYRIRLTINKGDFDERITGATVNVTVDP
ncbi:MAG: binary toxin-like calcium binding domain-containing protein [Planctomycetota bacterium]